MKDVVSTSLRLACWTLGALGNLFRSTAVQNHEVEPVLKQCTFTSRLFATTILEGEVSKMAELCQHCPLKPVHTVHTEDWCLFFHVLKC